VNGGGMEGGGSMKGGDGSSNAKSKTVQCEEAEATVGRVGKHYGCGMKHYVHRFTDKHMWQYIHQLTDERTILYSSVISIFLSSGAEEYITVIFLGTEEYKSTDEFTLFSCSEA
jgi:hypothetical protein